MARFFIDRPDLRLGDRDRHHARRRARRSRGCRSRSTRTSRRRRSTISATYPGASAKTVEDSVTQVIEQSMNGLDGLIYMSSTSEATGTRRRSRSPSTAGTDPDIAQVQVQNKLQLAMPLLPQEVQQQGVTRHQVAAAASCMVVGFVSDRRQHGPATTSPTTSAPTCSTRSAASTGVGDVQLFGAPYAMRIWLDPDKLDTYALTPARRRRARSARRTRRSRPASSAALPAVAGPAAERDHHARRTACRRRSSSATSCCAATPDGSRAAAAATSRASSSAPRTTSSSAATTASRRPAWPSRWPPAPTRSTPRERVQGDARASCSRSSRRASKAVVPFDTTPFVRAVDQGGGQDAGRGGRPGVPGDVPVPAELPRHADPDHRGAGGAAGHLRRARGARLLDQHADHVRHGAGDRPAGRRRHRGGRERRARDERGGPVAARGHAQVHGPDHRRAGRHRAGAVGGVRADGVLRRLDRRHLPPVLGDHRLGDGAVGAGGASC